ncbi:hypothetical protein KA005_40470, partial [bacterium]|nr:hypothetical protein [bacterium]
NKWKCWIVTFFYWVVEWVARIVGKWIIYTICRIVSALLTLGWTILIGLKWLWCNIPRVEKEQEDKRPRQPDAVADSQIPLDLRPLKRLQIEVVIIDKDETTKNPVDPDEIDDRIAKADRILKAAAGIEVKRKGKIRRDQSSSLYLLDSSSFSAKVSEWLKAIFLLIGRDSVRYLTVYVVGNIEGTSGGLHQPLYGSVFITGGTPHTTLAHELGHALLSVANAGHVDEKGNLMFVPWDKRQEDSGWPTETPTLTQSQWCSMRRSRWLDWTWYCERC